MKMTMLKSMHTIKIIRSKVNQSFRLPDFRTSGLKLFVLLITYHLSLTTSSQTIGNMSQADYRVIQQMNIGTYSPTLKRTNPSAYLELGDSLNSTKALLLPRGDTADVTNPVKGLIFFNLADSTVYQYRGTSGWE